MDSNSSIRGLWTRKDFYFVLLPEQKDFQSGSQYSKIRPLKLSWVRGLSTTLSACDVTALVGCDLKIRLLRASGLKPLFHFELSIFDRWLNTKHRSVDPRPCSDSFFTSLFHIHTFRTSTPMPFAQVVKKGCVCYTCASPQTPKPPCDRVHGVDDAACSLSRSPIWTSFLLAWIFFLLSNCPFLSPDHLHTACLPVPSRLRHTILLLP